EAAQAKQVNEARGEAEAIREVAKATAEGLREVATALATDGGDKAMQLRIAEDYLNRFGNLAKEGNTLIVPANLSDMTSMISAATKVVESTKSA
ncbi:MAG: band-7 C-terminal domain-containing protein, partial [Pseudomonadota bacterium]